MLTLSKAMLGWGWVKLWLTWGFDNFTNNAIGYCRFCWFISVFGVLFIFEVFWRCLFLDHINFWSHLPPSGCLHFCCRLNVYDFSLQKMEWNFPRSLRYYPTLSNYVILPLAMPPNWDDMKHREIHRQRSWLYDHHCPQNSLK